MLNLSFIGMGSGMHIQGLKTLILTQLVVSFVGCATREKSQVKYADNNGLDAYFVSALSGLVSCSAKNGSVNDATRRNINHHEVPRGHPDHCLTPVVFLNQPSDVNFTILTREDFDAEKGAAEDEGFESCDSTYADGQYSQEDQYPYNGDPARLGTGRRPRRPLSNENPPANTPLEYESGTLRPGVGDESDNPPSDGNEYGRAGEDSGGLRSACLHSSGRTEINGKWRIYLCGGPSISLRCRLCDWGSGSIELRKLKSCQEGKMAIHPTHSTHPAQRQY